MSTTAYDRSVVPAAGDIRPFEFPRVESYTLDNGMSVRVARMPGLPVVSISMVLEAGESGVDPSKAGLAVLTGNALDAGTTKRTGAELAEAVEGLGIGLGVSAGWDVTTVSLACLSERLNDAAELMAEVVGTPSFEEGEFSRFRQQRLASIEQRRMDPRSLADDAAAYFLFADGVPYQRPAAGRSATVQALTRDDSLAFVADTYGLGSGGLVISGDVDPDAVAALAGRLFGAGEKRERHRPAMVVEPRFAERQVHIVHRPGAVQSEIRIGHVGQARSSADHLTLGVLNTVLGGAFTSRLNLNLRERHGFTYGVRSQFAFRRHPGPFSVSTAVGTEVTAGAVREAMAELEAIVRDGPTDEEVQAARDYIVGVFPLRLETTGQVASRMAELLIHDLPDDYYATYRDRVRAVSTSDATEAARRAIHPDQMAIVVVGDAEAVKGPLEELDLGPLHVHEVSDLGN